MRIRNQIAVAVAPLFLGMTLVTGLLTYYLQVRELTWGLNEEATSIAVAAARLADAETVRRLAAGEQLANNPVRDQFQAIIGWGRARRITLLAGDNHQVLVDQTDGVAPDGAPTIPAPVAAALEREPFALTPARPEPGGGTSLNAFAPVRDAAGALLGVVAVEIRADTLAAQRAVIVQSALISLSAATLLGLLLAVLISTLITRRLSRLTRAVLRVEAAEAVPDLGTGVIHEVNDLVNTFETMKSVLSEVLARTRRTRLENEQFRTDEDLAGTFQGEFQRPVFQTIAGLEVAGSLLGRRPAGNFLGAWDLPAGGCAFVGTVSEQKSLAQTVVAASARAYLEQASRCGDLAPALESLAELFPLLRCTGVAWREGGQDLVRWSLDRGAGRWLHESLEPPAGGTVTLHTLDLHADRNLRTYVEQFHQLAPDALLREIPAIIEENSTGALLLLRAVVTGAGGDCG